MGYAFFILLPFLILFGHAGMLFQMLISSLILAMFYNFPPCNKATKLLMDAYVFQYRHNHHKQPLCIDTNELKFIKWTQNLIKFREDYKLLINGKI
jgi:hypothetical protein